MATRARIGIKQKSGRIISAYQHWDGYPGGLGYNLCENWEEPKNVTDSIKLGNSSKWGVIIGEKHDFDKARHGSEWEHMNCYYGRDRGEKDQGPRIFKNEADYLKNGFNSGEEYIYLLLDIGEKNYLNKPKWSWCFAHYSNATGFKPLEAEAIKEHIDILKRHLEMMAERKVA